MNTTLNGTKLLGYAVAGGILLVLADVAPKVAVGTTGLILLAVGLSHSDQLYQLSNWIGQTTGTGTPGDKLNRATKGN